MSVTQMLGEASGVRPEFVAAGVACAVAHPTQATKARYESLILAAEKSVIEALAADKVIDADRRAAMYADLTRAVAFERAHCVGGSLWAQYAQGGTKQAAGGLLFVLSLLEIAAPGGGWRPATIKDADLGHAVAADPAAMLAFAEVLPSFLEAILSDPRIPAEAREGLVADARSRLLEATPS